MKLTVYVDSSELPLLQADLVTEAITAVEVRHPVAEIKKPYWVVESNYRLVLQVPLTMTISSVVTHINLREVVVFLIGETK
jgi:hypothetical protein